MPSDPIPEFGEKIREVARAYLAGELPEDTPMRWTFIPCGQEHQSGRVCILQEGHQEQLWQQVRVDSGDMDKVVNAVLNTGNLEDVLAQILIDFRERLAKVVEVEADTSSDWSFIDGVRHSANKIRETR